MAESQQIMDALDARVQRREERRGFFKAAMGAAAVATAGGFFVSTAAHAQTVTDADIFNFALNLEYLEAQFYSYAANGVGLAPSLLTGTGTPGQVRGGRRVQFTDPIVARYAREIAADEELHVAYLRQVLGTGAVSAPTIDVSGGQGSAFAAAATAANLPGGSTFDPYASDENFLLGAFIFEDVGVTAYKGASPLITNKAFLEQAAGILAVEAYHAAIVRTTLYGKGVQTPSLRTAADAISNARDSLDGTTDLDQGISPMTVNGQTASNIVPLDGDGLAFSRTTGQVLNIVYLNRNAVTMGGFFPNGVNGMIRTSAQN